MGVVLNTAPISIPQPSTVVMALMQKMGYNPGKELGKDLQGNPLPVSINVQTSRARLVSFPKDH